MTNVVVGGALTVLRIREAVTGVTVLGSVLITGGVAWLVVW
ncbi:hypothetical protein [Jiangella aurantiaca]|nr:hypothetical protein [Jiangella aurantiaca]